MGNIPNEQSHLIGLRSADGSTTTTVSARDKHVEVLAVEADDIVGWELAMEDKGIEFTATQQVKHMSCFKNP